MISDAASSTAVATVVASCIGGVAAWLTQRSAAKNRLQEQGMVSRTDLERDAFERAKGFYVDTIERQDAEISECHSENRELRAEVVELKQRVKRLEDDLQKSQAALRAQIRRAGGQQ